MSNWRFNVGLGPLRYNRALKGSAKQQPKRKGSALGAIITLVVVLGLVYLCCWGGVAFMSRDI